MSQKREMLDEQKTLAAITLINNVKKDEKDNSIKNDLVACNLEEFITRLYNGQNTAKAEFTHLLNRCMDYTRADPHADPGVVDELKNVAEFIYRILRLPYGGKEKVDTIISALRLFQEKLIGAQRRHFHHKEKLNETWTQQILSNYNIIEPTTIYPMHSSRREKKLSSIFKKK